MTNGVKTDVLVVGGGPAGLFAAIAAADRGREVILLERNAKCGKKLRITGKGRCNVTNDSTPAEVMRAIPRNPRFLFSALDACSPADVMAFFEENGVPLKTERGRRVFPVSDNAHDIADALVKRARDAGVKILTERVSGLLTEEGAVTGVSCESGKTYFSEAVVLATGGRSYPLTGSTGDGYTLAGSVGHTVSAVSPSLVPIVSRDKDCPAMQGLSLKNVRLTLTENGEKKPVYEDFGEMMFTHFGLTGPMILSASAHMEEPEKKRYVAHIDMKPALSYEELDARLLSDFGKYGNRDFANSLGDLLPQKMIPVVIRRSGIDGRKKVNSVTKEERRALLAALKDMTFSCDGFRPIDEAIVTRGGVDVKEVSPKTMESKICRGLYFCGELLDLDAYTGGFNLQIAFSTGYAAGMNA